MSWFNRNREAERENPVWGDVQTKAVMASETYNQVVYLKEIPKNPNVITIGRYGLLNIVRGWKQFDTSKRCFWHEREKGYCEIRVRSLSVSRNHCVIYKADDGNYYVYDGDYGISNGKFHRGVINAIQRKPSRNGTWVNNTLIAKRGQVGEKMLESGDEITAGNFVFRLDQ